MQMYALFIRSDFFIWFPSNKVCQFVSAKMPDSISVSIIEIHIYVLYINLYAHNHTNVKFVNIPGVYVKQLFNRHIMMQNAYKDILGGISIIMYVC